MFTRNTLINKFKELLLTSDKQHVVLCGKFGIGKSRLIKILREDGTFREETTVYYESDENLIEIVSGLSDDISLVVVDPLHGSGESIIRTFIESYQGDKRIIWTSEDTIQDEKIASFILSPVSFREYTEEL